ncbi:transglutaminase family protein [Aestuariimicrobium ganziense]|uniref:transglutaminase family protein n=1 Tax=Aestuariimicrobium ganziense TaxID=2773677 RepID=UPI00194287C1|nr:transglutaminaseTgpA domain-containing protein [Aestuariimicrobium ganziense]
MSADTATQTRPRRAATSDAPAPRRISLTSPPRRGGVPFSRSQGMGRLRWLLVDLTALLALAGLLTVAFLPTYGAGWPIITVMGATVLGLALGVLGWWRRLNTAALAGAGVVAWFAFGGLLAMPSSLTAGVVPTMRTLRGLATGPVTAPKAMLTLDPPIGETWNLLTVPMGVALVSAMAGISISLRSKRPVLAWLPGVVAIGLAWLLGTSETVQPVPVAIATVALVLVWTAHRRRHLRETLVQQRRRSGLVQAAIGAVVVAAVGGATWLAAPALEGTQPRHVLRHRVAQPLEVHRYGSPLQSMRGVLTMNENNVMFSVSGAPSDSIVRLATMDSYDGLTYNVTNASDADAQMGQFRRVGARIPTTVQGTHAKVEVEIAALSTVWVPTLGQTERIRFHGPGEVGLADTFYYNRVTGTGVTTAGLSAGDRYTIEAIVPVRPDDSVISRAGAGQFAQPQLGPVPDTVKELAVRWSSSSPTRGAAALEIEKQLQLGYFSHGLPQQTQSLSGHSYDRILRLVANPAEMVGDEEQYAVTMAVMARHIGIPARVVYGYRVPEGGSGEVRGRDVGAWTELYLDELGWVMFNPTPPQDHELVKPSQENPPKPRPHVDNPPPLPKKPVQPPPDTNLPVDEGEKPAEDPPIDWKKIGTYAALTGIPAIALFGPIVLILGLKARRRKGRRHDPVIPNRVAGAWSELVDKARDLKHASPPTATRSEQAEALVLAFPSMIEEADPIGLAKRADHVVFAPESISEEHADNYWATIHAAERGLRKSVSPWTWVKGRLSTRSFRTYR